MKKVYMLVVSLLLAMVSQAATKTVTLSMSKDIDGDAFGQLLVDNSDWGKDDVEGDGEGNVEYPGEPFIFNYYSQDGADYNDSNNLLAVYGYLAIKCTAGNIVGLEANIYNWDEEDKPKGKIRGGLDFNWNDAGVGTLSLNKDDDEMLIWTADNEGYPLIVMDISNNAIWFNKLKITYIPDNGGGDDPVVTPPAAPTDGYDNELVQSDFVDTFNPDLLDQDITITRNKDYNVYGFDFKFTGSSSKTPTFVYKTNSDDDVLGEVNVYGGDSFTITTGKTIDKEAVSMTYATFKLTSTAKVTADKGQVSVIGTTMTWWGDPAQSVTFTVDNSTDACLAFKESVIYTDKKIFSGGASSGGREYYIIKDGTVTKSALNLFVESSGDFSLTVGAIPPALGVDVQTITIKVDGKSRLADTKRGQYSTANFPGPFTNKQEIPVEITFLYEGGATTVPFSVTYPNSIVYKPNAPFTYKNAVNTVATNATATFEMVNDQNLPLTYSVADPEIASIDAEGNVTGISAGETTITATFAGNDNYLAGTATATVIVGQGQAPLSVASEALTVKATQYAAIQMNNPKNLPLTYSSSNTAIATVDADGIVTGVGAGNANITVSFAGNDDYVAKDMTVVVTVEKTDAPIVMQTLSYAVALDQTVQLVLDNSLNLPLTYTSTDQSIASVDANGLVTGIGVGETTISIAFAGNDTYNPISFTAKVDVAKGDAPLSMITSSYSVMAGDTTPLDIDNPKNLSLTYISSNEQVVTVSEDGTITGVAPGTTTISIVFKGNDSYWAYSMTAEVTVTENSGIEGIYAEGSESIYYDLRGQRLYNPAKGTVVIRVEGRKATKMIIK